MHRLHRMTTMTTAFNVRNAYGVNVHELSNSLAQNGDSDEQEAPEVPAVIEEQEDPPEDADNEDDQKVYVPEDALGQRDQYVAFYHFLHDHRMTAELIQNDVYRKLVDQGIYKIDILVMMPDNDISRVLGDCQFVAVMALRSIVKEQQNPFGQQQQEVAQVEQQAEQDRGRLEKVKWNNKEKTRYRGPPATPANFKSYFIVLLMWFLRIVYTHGPALAAIRREMTQQTRSQEYWPVRIAYNEAESLYHKIFPGSPAVTLHRLLSTLWKHGLAVKPVDYKLVLPVTPKQEVRQSGKNITMAPNMFSVWDGKDAEGRKQLHAFLIKTKSSGWSNWIDSTRCAR